MCVVVTGGLAHAVLPVMQHEVTYVENLTLEGLYHIFMLNSKRILRESSR
jgi:pantothenate kinase type III